MLSALGDKVKRFCVIKKWFPEGLLVIPKHDGSEFQTIASYKQWKRPISV